MNVLFIASTAIPVAAAAGIAPRPHIVATTAAAAAAAGIAPRPHLGWWDTEVHNPESTATPTIGAQAALEIIPSTVPPWPPTYNMSMSTLTMTCNSSGWSNAARGAQFGIVSYDWSNAKPVVDILQNTFSDRTHLHWHSYGPDPHSC